MLSRNHVKSCRYKFILYTGVNHEELVGLAKQHLSGVSFEYQDDAVPVLSPCRFTGSEVRDAHVWVSHASAILNFLY